MFVSFESCCCSLPESYHNFVIYDSGLFHSFVRSIIYSFHCYLCVFGWYFPCFHKFSFITVKSKAIFVVISLPSLSLLTANFIYDLDINLLFIRTWLCNAITITIYPFPSSFNTFILSITSCFHLAPHYQFIINWEIA